MGHDVFNILSYKFFKQQSNDDLKKNIYPSSQSTFAL